MSNFNKLLAEVKEAGQDFEWYPTTQEIIEELSKNIGNYTYRDNIKILDVGAGNGNVLNQLENLHPKSEDGRRKRYYTKYAIEQSPILLNNLDSDIFVVGTDFHQQTFIDKTMDVIFCNPPYSEFEEWSIKLIEEGNCGELFLVIPDRWKDNKKIIEAIETRKAKYEIVGNYSFLDSEFRKARANVDLIKITIGKEYSGRLYNGTDPFAMWFDKNFSIDINSKKQEQYQKTSQRKQEIKNELTDKSKVIDNLVKFYTDDMTKLMNNYKALENLDSSLMEELGINLEGVMNGLKLKIEGFKNLYWNELFDNLEAITDRLTSASRKKLLDTLTTHTSVDFSQSNIYAIVIWAIKNSNNYIDAQLLDLYEKFTHQKNVLGYKSNRHMVEDTWRYCSDFDFRNNTTKVNYKLDYRCVIEGSYGVTQEWLGRDSKTRENLGYRGSVTDYAHTLIQDIFTIAKNLGFTVENDSKIREWEAGKKQEFYTSKGEMFAEIKAFKNGNIHYKLNQEFMKKFNVQAGKLNGWIKTPEDVVEEMGLKLDEATRYFKSNMHLLSSNVKLLA